MPIRAAVEMPDPVQAGFDVVTSSTAAPNETTDAPFWSEAAYPEYAYSVNGLPVGRYETRMDGVILPRIEEVDCLPSDIIDVHIRKSNCTISYDDIEHSLGAFARCLWNVY